MAIDLLRSFLQKGQSVTTNQKSNTAQNTQTLPQNLQNMPQNIQVLRAIRALKAGQTLQGEILSVSGEDVQLAIMKDVIIDAKLAQSMKLNSGMNLTFQVKSNNSNGLSLMPLFTNTAADPNVLKALDMAGIPANDRTMEMVQTLMQKGMPIDKQSLQEVYRDVVAFKDTPVNNIISLRQMNMPVTSENIQQLFLYENNQHFLSDTFSDIGKAMGQQMESWIAEGNVESAKEFLNSLRQLLGNNIQDTGTLQNAAGSENLNGATAQTPAVMTGAEGQIILTEEMLLGDTKQNSQAETTQSNTVGQENAAAQNAAEENIAEENTANKPVQTTKNQVTWDKLLELVSREKTPGKFSEAFEKLWDKEVKGQWLMDAETVMDKEKVQDFYEKLTRQVKQLEAFLDEKGMGQSNVGKAVQNTASNLDFMNQLNQMHAYIQFPLKLTDQNAHGELYVYTNKRSLAKQDGKVTALLHLGMEHLGEMDIYVALENQKVSTQFYLEKEEYLDFLEQHMDMLTSRLNKRGYDCSVKTCLRQEKNDEAIIKKIENSKTSPILLSTQAFDIRA